MSRQSGRCLPLVVAAVLSACSTTAPAPVIPDERVKAAEREAEYRRAASSEAVSPSPVLAPVPAPLDEARRRAEQERQAEEARIARVREEDARIEAARQAEREAQEEVARQRQALQVREQALEARLAETEQQTEAVEAANALFRQALAAAEELAALLEQERQYLASMDPDTGQLQGTSQQAKIDALREEKARLEQEAQRLVADTVP